VLLIFLALLALQYKNEDPATCSASPSWKAYAIPATGIIADIEFCRSSKPTICHPKWVYISIDQTYSLAILITFMKGFIINKTLKEIQFQSSSTLSEVIRGFP
jgi:hypothetical protein